MTNAAPATRPPAARGIAALLLLFTSVAWAQEEAPFDDAEAADELTDFAEVLALEQVDSEFLTSTRARIGKIEVAAAACASQALAVRTRLEERFGPLKEVDPEVVSEETLAQRQEISTALDEAIARQAVCEGIFDKSKTLIEKISERQNRLAQQFLTSRTKSALVLLREFPQQLATWPERLRAEFTLELVEGMTVTRLGWSLVAAALLALFLGFVVRRSFARWYAAAGGDTAPPRMKYMFPKPLAEFAPLWMLGVAFLVVLALAIPEITSSLAAVRIAWAMLAFGFGAVIINWVTGPLSPSRDVKGLIPDHVAPVRLRLRLVLLAVCISYVVLGQEWLTLRIVAPNLTGRASMIFLVGISVLALLLYLGRIPGLHRRYRALRFLSTAATIVALIGLLAGYQNLANYLVQGVTRTTLALFLLWVLLWLVYFLFNYLIEEDSPAANQVRSSLGFTRKGTGTGIGFMQLIADLVLWISVVVYLIYVWDNTGTTLPQLRDVIVQGWTFGGVTLVPMNIVGFILIFAALIVVVGWIKRWIDRRWLQRIVIERGAREAILTLFGYLGFIVAIVIALVVAEVDLTGLAIISGALALGLGFGMQEIANNFVSGLILLFERPIRTGDFVTVGDVDGFVRRIRIRATEIETLDNQNVLVPNSELISGRVTNWVLRDTQGRLQVRVGVAYGSDTELVREILERIGNEHPEVITDGRAPAPQALFTGFGDSSLDFELRVRVKRIERRFSVMSDMNFLIDKAFREAGIAIPFPQRDLHIISSPEPDAAVTTRQRGRRYRPDAPEVTRSFEIELASKCSRDEVWAAVTEIESLKGWLVKDGAFDARAGGKVDVVMRDDHIISGRLDVFFPPRHLRIVLETGDEEGPIAGGPITTDIRIFAEEDGSLMTVRVTGIPANEDWEEYYRRMNDRWQLAIADLKANVLGR